MASNPMQILLLLVATFALGGQASVRGPRDDAVMEDIPEEGE